jgi:hypothetical protein
MSRGKSVKREEKKERKKAPSRHKPQPKISFRSVHRSMGSLGTYRGIIVDLLFHITILGLPPQPVVSGIRANELEEPRKKRKRK